MRDFFVKPEICLLNLPIHKSLGNNNDKETNIKSNDCNDFLKTLSL